MYESFCRFSLILLFLVDNLFGVNELSLAISLSEPVSESTEWFRLILLFGFDDLFSVNEL